MLMNVAVDTVVEDILRGPGFHIIEGMIPELELQRTKEAITRLRNERGIGFCPDKTNRERIFGIIYEDAVFERIATAALPIAQRALGTPDVSLSSFSVHTVNPGTGSIGMHVDYPYGTMQAPLPASPVFGLQLIWAIDEFTAANGATICCPGSQLRIEKPPAKVGPDVYTKQLCAPAGSLIVTHCLCWHDSGENTSTSPRIALLANFTPSYIKPIEYPYFEVRKPLTVTSAEAKAMLGLTFYDSVTNALAPDNLSGVNWRKKNK